MTEKQKQKSNIDKVRNNER